jgi:putative exosortase-associated protein (TIGR04073 family)
MKKIVLAVILSALIVSAAQPAFCAGPLEKLGRGVSNIFTSPAEIPYRMTKSFNNSRFPEAAILGFSEGVAMMCFRLFIGVSEVLTFPVPVPEKYAPVITDPEYLWKIK